MAIYKPKPELAILHGGSLTEYALLRKTNGSNDKKQNAAKLGACVLGVMILGKAA